MRSTILVSLATLAVVAAYTDKYDGINIEEVMENCRLMKQYGDCVFEDVPESKCTQEALELKKDVKGAIQNDCAECNETQKEKARRAIGILYNVHKLFWDIIIKKYDPEGTYLKKHQAELDKSTSEDYSKFKPCDPKTGKAVE